MPSFIVEDSNQNPVAGSLSYDSVTNTVTFTASANLAPNTLFTVKITTEAKDLAGNSLENDFTWSFTTGEAMVDDIPPAVVAVSPLDGSSNIGLDQVIKATFSEPMDVTTLTT